MDSRNPLGVGRESASSGRRGRILESGAELFARWGYDKTSMEDVAKEAGISKGAVYLEFSGKEDLFRAVLSQEFGRYAGEWLKRFEADPGDWSFARMFQHSLGAMKATPLVLALFSWDQRMLGSFLRSDTRLLSQMVYTRSELFSKMQDVGALRSDIPARTLAYLLTVFGYGLLTGDEVIPQESRVSFDEALPALGLLLDRALSPETARGKKQGREFILEVVRTMKLQFQNGGEDRR